MSPSRLSDAATVAHYLAEARNVEAALHRLLQTQVLACPEGDYGELLRRHLRSTDDRAERLADRLVEIAERGPVGQSVPGVLDDVSGQALELFMRPIGLARRGTREERLLRNAKAVVAAEAFGTATYHALEAVCRQRADGPTAELAAELRDEHDHSLAELRQLLPALARAAVGSSPEPTALHASFVKEGL